ncbi:hypothetical protein RSA46_06515 [Pseudomonas oryzihabitans]|nr:hypothetical protein SB5_19720 [Pseudomonas psychrotolerans]KTT45603.1 hypothetical protein RSA46_06515 [Pseudomonas psychrotolerans]
MSKTAKTSESSQARLAVLIDADNAPAAIVDGLMAEIARFGVASVKRIYGDWTQPQLNSWKKVLLDHSIQPVQQFGYTKGKNATDSALIIDAMDLLYTRRFDGFCLVSSDSDFTRLAARLREEGLTVYGFGEEKTPDPFVSACDRFIYTEILRSKPREESREASSATDKPATTNRGKPKLSTILKLIEQAVEDASDEGGWANLGMVGANLGKVRPDFDARLYGHRKFSGLVKAHGDRFEVQERDPADGSAGKAVYIRNR